MKLTLLQKIIRFSITGLGVTGLHFLIVVFLVEKVDLASPLANGIAFSVATVTSYIFNSYWSFVSPLHKRTLLRFITVSLLGLTTAIFVSWQAHLLSFNYITGVFAVIIAVSGVSFILNNYWTFK